MTTHPKVRPVSFTGSTPVCESVRKVDPMASPRKPLIDDLDWRLGGVTIGADDAPPSGRFSQQDQIFALFLEQVNLRRRFTLEPSAGAAAPLSRVFGPRAVGVPESFRGGCSFGGRSFGSLPLVDPVQKQSLGWHLGLGITQYCSASRWS
jgi:hypothetical protein